MWICTACTCLAIRLFLLCAGIARKLQFRNRKGESQPKSSFSNGERRLPNLVLWRLSSKVGQACFRGTLGIGCPVPGRKMTHWVFSNSVSQATTGPFPVLHCNRVSTVRTHPVYPLNFQKLKEQHTSLNNAHTQQACKKKCSVWGDPKGSWEL